MAPPKSVAIVAEHDRGHVATELGKIDLPISAAEEGE